MKVQWQLLDKETGKVIVTLGEPFDFFPDDLKEKWERRNKGLQVFISDELLQDYEAMGIKFRSE